MCGQRREAGPLPGGGDVTAGGPRVPFGRGDARVERVNTLGVALTVAWWGGERGHRPGQGCAGRGVAWAGSARGLLQVGLVLGRAVRQRGGEHGLHRAYRRLDGGVQPWGTGRIRVTFATRRRRGPPPARLGRATAARGRHAACLSRAIAMRRRRHTAARRGPPPARLGRAAAARGRHVACSSTRDRDAPAAAQCAAARRGPPPAQLGRVTAARGRHAACSSRAIATRRRRHIVRPLGAGLRQRSWGGQMQSADGTRHARLARSRHASSGTQSGRSARSSASAAGEVGRRARTARSVLVTRDRDAPAAAQCAAALRGLRWPPGDCSARTAHGVLVPRQRDAPAAAHSAAVRRGPSPALLGRATAARGRASQLESRWSSG
jgi:hypothetical protein